MESRPQPRAERRRLSHMDRAGRPRMVDVSDKPVTARRAVAEAAVAMSHETMSLVIDGGGTKGDVLGVAELAGVMGGKRTSDLIPLCHPLALTDLVVAITPDRAAGVLRIRAEAATTGQTGVEMEAMTAASVAALTVYDMVKGVERGVEIQGVRLVSKTGGKSGTWVRHDPPIRRGARRIRSRAPVRARPVAWGRSTRARADPDDRAAGRAPRSSSPPATAPRPASARTRRAPGWGSASKPSASRVDRGLVARRPPGRSRSPSSTAPARHDLVITTGGTGLTPRDVTPQATQAAIDYEVPGLAEAMRAAGRASTPLADLSRGVVGVRGRTLIVNLPGSPKGALESLEAIVPVLDHALETLAGPYDHAITPATTDEGG